MQEIVVGRVAQTSTYPVKSALGLSGRLMVAYGGAAGDRQYVVQATQSGQILTGKNSPGNSLLRCQAVVDEAAGVHLYIPDGGATAWDDPDTNAYLSALMDMTVLLRPAADLSGPTPTNSGFDIRAGAWAYDSSPLHLITTASLAMGRALLPGGLNWAPARFRPNLVIQTMAGVVGWIENDWVGCWLRFPSGLLVEVVKPTVRCPLPARPQGGHSPLPASGAVSTLKRHHNESLGVYLRVLYPGKQVVEVGHEVTLIRP